MKKTLAAVAVLGAFAGSALAADVQLYGIVDLGFAYSHVDSDTTADDLDSFSMENGLQSTSRWGIKGTEDLGNGLTVGFILENGFGADTGADNEPMFDRESSLFLEGSFGKLAFGRIGSFNQGQGSWSLIGRITPFGTSFGNYSAQAGNVFASSTRFDNAIAYQTPSFAGFKVYAMYGMGSNGNENESSSDRYYGIAATYDNGPVSLYAAVDSTNYQSAGWAAGAENLDLLSDPDDSLTVTLGGSYNLEVVKLYLGAQYFDNAKLGSLGGIADNNAALNPYGASATRLQNYSATGYSILLGADAPVAGGKLMAAAAYVDAEQSDRMEEVNDMYDFSRWVVSVGYDYPLSKRTNVYAVASYMNDDVELTGVAADRHTGQDDWNPSAYTFMVGMRHKF